MLLLALIALGVPLGISLRDRVDSEVKGQARSQADVVAATASELLGRKDREALHKLVTVSSESVRGRVIVVDARGRLIADSAGAPEGRPYGDRPEVRAALGGSSDQTARNSSTLGTEILATAVPVLEHGAPHGAVRITQSVDAVNRAVRSSLLGLALLGGIVLLLALAAGALISQQIARPIRRLDRAARSVAGGDLETTVAVAGSSEQRSLARAFNEMTERVRRLLRSQQDFVADASHQLRTPLTGLRLRLENLTESLRGDRASRAELEASMKEIDRLSLIVDELLVLSRAGEHELPGERLELLDTARRAAERSRAAAGEHEIEIAVGGDPGASALCAGPDLDRAVDALVENAIVYSPRGTVVRIEAAPGSLSVLDEGPGLAPGEEAAVFERFSRGAAGRGGPGGTGLGLPIARELARQWGGDVTLTNLDGHGLRAVIELPR